MREHRGKYTRGSRTLRFPHLFHRHAQCRASAVRSSRCRWSPRARATCRLASYRSRRRSRQCQTARGQRRPREPARARGPSTRWRRQPVRALYVNRWASQSKKRMAKLIADGRRDGDQRARHRHEGRVRAELQIAEPRLREERRHGDASCATSRRCSTRSRRTRSCRSRASSCSRIR